MALDCFYSLQTEQGGEGQLFPGSCCVRCSDADDCPYLRKGRCPLTAGLGEVLNSLKVRVLHGVRHLIIGEGGGVCEVGQPRAEGVPIWFGKTTVIGSHREPTP